MALNIGILTPGFGATEGDWAIPVVQNLVRELARTDNVRVIALRYPHTRQPYDAYGARVIPLGYGAWTRGVRRFALWLDALRVLRRLHREQPFDVFHAMWSDETGALAAWAGRLLGVPSVTSIGGGELVYFPDLNYGLQGTHLGRWTVGQALRGATAVTVSGSHNRALIKQVGYNIPDSKIYTVVLGVDTDLFTPADVPRESNRLLHVGSLVDIKDQATLLWALWGLDESVQLDIIGDGPLRPALERLAEELRISHRVNFLGSVPHQMVVDHYRRAALHIMSSRNEAGPMTTIEAAACGLPTISTAVGMLVDYPSIGLTVKFREGNHAALAAMIATLLNNDQWRIALGRSAYETVREQFSLRHTAQRFREVYATVI